MKKEYIKPIVDKYLVTPITDLLTASPGVTTGDGLGDEFDPDDKDYSKGTGGSSMWEYMEDEE